MQRSDVDLTSTRSDDLPRETRGVFIGALDREQRGSTRAVIGEIWLRAVSEQDVTCPHPRDEMSEDAPDDRLNDESSSTLRSEDEPEESTESNADEGADDAPDCDRDDKACDKRSFPVDARTAECDGRGVDAGCGEASRGRSGGGIRREHGSNLSQHEVMVKECALASHLTVDAETQTATAETSYGEVLTAYETAVTIRSPMEYMSQTRHAVYAAHAINPFTTGCVLASIKGGRARGLGTP
jgi:hypothetical protein